MGVDFVQLSHDFLGTLPVTLNWLYDFVTVVFVIGALTIIMCPVIFILSFIKNRRYH